MYCTLGAQFVLYLLSCINRMCALTRLVNARSLACERELTKTACTAQWLNGAWHRAVTVLNQLKALQLRKVVLSTIKCRTSDLVAIFTLNFSKFHSKYNKVLSFYFYIFPFPLERFP